MAFDTLESSIEDGRPIYLYKFTLNDKVWRYTSADEDQVIGDFVWEAVPISDSGRKQTGETNTDALSIETVATIAPSRIYADFPPARPMAVAILRTHAQEPTDMKVTYVGEVSQHTFSTDPGKVVFVCETIAASMRREGLRLAWQRDCPYALYDPVTCKANKELHKVVFTIEYVTGSQLNSSGLVLPFADGLAGGFFEWLDPERGIERRAIERSGEHYLVVFGSMYGLEVGQEITAYRGCARTVQACISFDNLPNYGGIPDLAGKSPFDGSPVFL